MTSCPGEFADPPAARPVPLRLERRRPAPGQVTLRSPGNPLPATHLADLTMAERKEAAAAAGLPAFRAHQASQHYFERWAAGPEEMTNLPGPVRATLKECLFPPILTLAKNVMADDGMTVKQVWRLHDGALVESVLMRYPKRVTMCISSQAGCGMNCPFCATGQEGFTRNLSTAEMGELVVWGMRWLAHADPNAAESPLRVSNVVFMGMGEALVNYKRAVAAIRRMVDPAPDGMGMSARGITMSTVGLVPGVQKLAGEGLPVTLALSLHAPDDDLRNELVPLNVRYPVAEVLDVAHEYFERTKRRVSIEYALIKDINDQAWRAELLADELNRRGKGWVHVNPIPLNPTPGSKWTASRPGVMQQFVERLVARGVPTTIRDTRGQDIDGACGQLAAKTA